MVTSSRSLQEFVVRGRRRTPTVRRVRELLRVSIVQRLLRGDVLPSECELISSYGTSRGVVREALELLRAEGLIDRLQGAGTFAVSPERQVFPIEEADGMIRNLDDGGARVRWDLLEYEVVPAPTLIAERLHVPVGADVVYAERRHLLDGEPIVLRSSWMPPDVGAVLVGDPAATRRSLNALVEQALGHPIERADLRIEATLADSSTTEVLGVAVGDPLVLLERLVFDVHGRPVEYGHSRMRADRAALTTVMRRPGVAAAECPSAVAHSLAMSPRQRGHGHCSTQRWALHRRSG